MEEHADLIYHKTKRKALMADAVVAEALEAEVALVAASVAEEVVSVEEAEIVVVVEASEVEVDEVDLTMLLLAKIREALSLFRVKRPLSEVVGFS